MQEFENFPENYPLYKDSGLWQLRSDNMEEVLLQQKATELFENFISRCIEFGKNINL